MHLPKLTDVNDSIACPFSRDKTSTTETPTIRMKTAHAATASRFWSSAATMRMLQMTFFWMARFNVVSNVCLARGAEVALHAVRECAEGAAHELRVRHGCSPCPPSCGVSHTDYKETHANFCVVVMGRFLGKSQALADQHISMADLCLFPIYSGDTAD